MIYFSADPARTYTLKTLHITCALLSIMNSEKRKSPKAIGVYISWTCQNRVRVCSMCTTIKLKMPYQQAHIATLIDTCLGLLTTDLQITLQDAAMSWQDVEALYPK